MKNPDMRRSTLVLTARTMEVGCPTRSFYMIGGLLALSVVLAVLSFTVFRLPWLKSGFFLAAAAFLALLCWCGWIRKQYARRRWDDGADPPVPARPPGLRWQGRCWMWAAARRPVHPGALTWPEAQVVSTIGAWHTATASPYAKKERRQ